MDLNNGTTLTKITNNENNNKNSTEKEQENEGCEIEDNNEAERNENVIKVGVLEVVDVDRSVTTTTTTTIADIIGEYGLYQLSITLLTLIRYICVAMMTNTGPLIAPEVDYKCQPPNSIQDIIKIPTNITIDDYLKNKCYLELNDGSQFKCSSWTYNTTEYGVTLTDSFNLICERDWLRSAFQSAVSCGVVIASVIWGSISDRHGRVFAIRLCFLWSLISGIVSYFANNYLLYSLSRAFCSFGDLGLVVSLSTILVETLGNKYRGVTCLIVYTGWSYGVMIMPWLTGYFRDYRQLMGFTVICHVLTFPWLLTINESIRWSMVNGYFEPANQEIKRILRWNLKSNDKCSIEMIDKKFDKFKEKFLIIAQKIKIKRDSEEYNLNGWQLLSLSIFGGLTKVGQLFQSKTIAITTITLIWITFNSELLYMLFITFNSDIGNDINLNYAVGGLMETLATVISIGIVSKVTRKLSLISILVSISSICFLLAFTHELPKTSIWVLNIGKLAVSTLSSLVYLTTTESFPTNLRQTGFGLSGTLGSLGAVVAPFMRTELVRFIGLTNVLLIIVVLPLTAVAIIPFFLKETKGVELPDDVDDIESI